MKKIFDKLLPWKEINQLLATFKKGQTIPGFCCLQIHPDGVAYTYLAWKNQKPELQYCDFVPYPSAGKTHDKIAAIFGKIISQHKLHGVACSWVLDASDYKVLSVEAPAVPANEMRNALRWQINDFKDLLGFPLEQAVLDYFPAPSTGVSKTNTVNVVVANLPHLTLMTELIQSAGFRLTTIDIPELALLNLLNLFPAENTSIGLIWLQPAISDIIISLQKTLYVMRYIEQTLTELFVEPALEALTPNIEKLALEIERSLNYYRNQLRQTAPVKFLLTLNNPILLTYLNMQLGNTVELLQLNTVLDIKNPIAEKILMRCIAVIGGALRQEAVNATTN